MLGNKHMHVSYNLTMPQSHPIHNLKMHYKRHIGVVKENLKIEMDVEK